MYGERITRGTLESTGKLITQDGAVTGQVNYSTVLDCQLSTVVQSYHQFIW